MRFREGHSKDPSKWPRNLETDLKQLYDGKILAAGSFTITASVATTTVKDYRVGKDSVILLMPLTANAAAALATTYIQTTDISSTNNQFTVNHANNAQTDRDFRYVVLGASLA